MFRFGRGAIDVPMRFVEFDGQPQHLEPQAFDLLAYLLAHRDRVVPKFELLDEIWGDQFVSESALTTRIKEARRAVGDDGARQEVIKNFRGRGYRFVASVDEHPHGETRVAPTSAPLATSLLGRDGDIEATISLLESSRLVTLVGPGGVGKTSLARDVARRRRDLHADGVAMVRLAPVRDPDAIAHVLRRDTGLDETGSDETDLIAAIADLDALVVIDNCEHVIDEISRLVAAITDANGRVRLLTTSRIRLGVHDEHVWPVTPLDADTARLLLLERVRTADPTYEWSPDSETAVMELLVSLDRLPLAIEMAAARLPSIGAEGLAELLDDRLDLLRTSDRSAEDRHRTIGKLIEWSEDLLDDQERDLLTILSTFAGPAIASDLAAVAGIHSTELAVGPLAALVDQSLVVADTVRQPTSYRLLETVRARAAQRRSPTHEALHANHVIDIATEMDRRLRTPDEPLAARRLDSLDADIRLAHQWARGHDTSRAGELTAALIHYAHERHRTEPASWARHLVDELDPNDPAWLAAAAACGADHSNRGEYERAGALAERALVSSDLRVVASAHDTLGNVGVYTGDLAAAFRHYSMLREFGERANDAMVRSLGLVGEVVAMAYDGRADEALERLRRDHDPTVVSTTTAAWISYAEGEILSSLGREHDAIEHLERAIHTGSSVGSRFVVGVAQVSALAARTRTGDLDEARAAFVPVLAHYRRTRNLTHGITALRSLVELLVRAGQDVSAMMLLGALSNPDVKATYGVESQRLDAARATVEGRADRSDVGTWMEQGASHDPMWAFDHAISVLS